MAELIATLPEVTRRLDRAAVPRRDWNPVYRALEPPPAELPEPAGPALPGAGGPEDLLLIRQITARALLTLALTDGSGTRRLRIALHLDGASVEVSRAADPSRWRTADLDELPRLLAEFVSGSGLDTGMHLTVAREADGLRLDDRQTEAVRAALEDGAPPEQAFDAAPDLPAPLRDALTADGPRGSISITLHDPSARAADRPVTWSRLWVRGQEGLYRTDATEAPFGAIHPVADGDVLGTVVPLLEEGLRFAASAAASGDRR